MRWAWLLLLLLLPVPAAASGYADLGTLEREAVDDALAMRGLTIEPEPQGKMIAQVHVVNLDVFLARERVPLVWANIFHRTTRESHVLRESLLHAGDHYDQALVEETTRNLQEPTLSNVVAVLPVRSMEPGMVELLIVTRDVWSLRFNQDYEAAGGRLNYYTASLSENNLFGWRKNLAAVFVMDQGSMSFGPSYIDPNVLGTRLRLRASFSWLWERELGGWLGGLRAGAQEGTRSTFSLEYPLWSLARRWGAYADFNHYDGVVRRFYGSELYPEPLGNGATAPWVYRMKSVNTYESVTRSFPTTSVIHRVSLGHEFALSRPTFMSDFPYPEGSSEREQFARKVFPLSERASEAFLAYELFTPTYRTLRDFNTFDFREDTRIGPWLWLKAGQASTALGSERNFAVFQTSFDMAGDLLGGLQGVGASWESRVYDSQATDQLMRGRFVLATPVLGGVVRVVAAGNMAVLMNNRRGRYFLVGGSAGADTNPTLGDGYPRTFDSVLRGYPVNAFYGTGAKLVGHVEVRTMAIKLAFLRLGGLVFFDAGHAAEHLDNLSLYEDVGFGLRLLLPQLNTYALRADWAFPLRTSHRSSTTPEVPAGWPGRMTFGFRQVF
jgi:hypothetical protein